MVTETKHIIYISQFVKIIISSTETETVVDLLKLMLMVGSLSD